MTTHPGTVLGGVAPVVEAVAARLEANVPDELDLLDAAYGRPVPLAVDGDPDLWRPPGLYARTDRAIVGPDDYPTILVVPQSTDAARIEDMVAGRPVWRIPYRLRVWGFCRYFGSAEVVACRDRLALAVLQTLLRHPKLSTTMAVDLAGWRQSFSDAGVDDDDASSVAGFYLELTVTAVESVTLDSVADADTLTVLVHPEAD